MDAALITLYKNSVILRVFDKLSSSCLAFNKGWALKKKSILGLQYGKGLIYLRPIFRLTKLAFHRARATLKRLLLW